MRHLRPVALLVVCLLALLSAHKAIRVRADFPSADLSTALTFNCLPDGSVRVGFKWTSSYQGAQWVDLSLFNNDFAQGTAQSAGPLPSGQVGLTWDGLVPGAWHFVRVNTLAPDGWHPSSPLVFYTPEDCRLPFASTPYYPPDPPTTCLNLDPASLSGCVWTQRPDYERFGLGEPVIYCYNISQPMLVRLVAVKPDGGALVITDRYDNGNGGCSGPYQANFPLGVRSVALYGGPSYQLLSATHFVVR